MASLSCTLLQLPTELLTDIIDRLRRPDLCSVSRVCAHLRVLGEPLIYQDILIRNGQQAAAIAEAITKCPSRATMTRTLRVANRGTSEEGQYEKIPGILRLFERLQELKIESPPSNKSSMEVKERWLKTQDQYGAWFSRASIFSLDSPCGLLTSLRSCTFYLLGSGPRSGYGLSPMATIAAIFLHPTLQELNIARAHIDYEPDLPWFLRDPVIARSTKLAALNLEQCDISDSGLAVLLRIPLALKSLTISESERYGPRKFSALRVAALSNALGPHRDCLETLALENVPFGDVAMDLSDFPALQQIELGGGFVRSMVGRDGSHDCRLSPIFPPRLKSLKFGQAYYRYRVEGRQIRPYIRDLLAQRTAHKLSEWQKLSVCIGEPEGTMGKFTKAHHEFGKECATYGLRFVAIGVTSTPGYIPPYFFGEPFPRETVLYDSADEKEFEVPEPDAKFRVAALNVKVGAEGRAFEI